MKFLVSILILINSHSLWALPNNDVSDSLTGTLICNGGSSSSFNDCNQNNSSVRFCTCIDYRDNILFPGMSKNERYESLKFDLDQTHNRLSKSYHFKKSDDLVNLKLKQVENLHQLAKQIGIDNFSCVDKESLLKKMNIPTKEGMPGVPDLTPANLEKLKVTAPPWVRLYFKEENQSLKSNVKQESKSQQKIGLSIADQKFLLDKFTYVFKGEKVDLNVFQDKEKRSAIRARTKEFHNIIASNKDAQQMYSGSTLFNIFSSNNGFSIGKFAHSMNAWAGELSNNTKSAVFTPAEMVKKIDSNGKLLKDLGFFLNGACERLNFLVDLEINDFKKSNIESAKLEVSNDLQQLKNEEGNDWTSSIDRLNTLVSLREANIKMRRSEDEDLKIMSLKDNVDRLYCRAHDRKMIGQNVLSRLGKDFQMDLLIKRNAIKQNREDILDLEQAKQNLRIKCPTGTKDEFINKLMSQSERVTTKARAEEIYSRRFKPALLEECSQMGLIDNKISQSTDKQKEAINDYEKGLVKELIKFLDDDENKEEAHYMLSAFGIKDYDSMTVQQKHDVHTELANQVSSAEVTKVRSNSRTKILAPNADGFIKQVASETYARVKNEIKRIDRSSIIRESSDNDSKNERAKIKSIINKYDVNGNTTVPIHAPNVADDNDEKLDGESKWYDSFMPAAKKTSTNTQNIQDASQLNKMVEQQAKAKEEEEKKLKKIKDDSKNRDMDLKKMLASLIDSKKNDDKKVKNDKTKKSSSEIESERSRLEMAELKRKKIQLEIENLNLEKERLKISDDINDAKKKSEAKVSQARSSELSPSSAATPTASFTGGSSASKDSKSSGKEAASGQSSRSIASGGGSGGSAAAISGSVSDNNSYAVSNPFSTPSFTLSQTDVNSLNKELSVIEVKENILNFPPGKREAYIQNLFKNISDKEILIKLPNGEVLKVEKDDLKKQVKKKELKEKEEKRSPAELRERFKLEDLEGHMAPILKE